MEAVRTGRLLNFPKEKIIYFVLCEVGLRLGKMVCLMDPFACRFMNQESFVNVFFPEFCDNIFFTLSGFTFWEENMRISYGLKNYNF